MELDALLAALRGYVPGSGDLPEPLFLFLSTLTPIPNVDLLVTDDAGRLLLSWRDDPYFGRGWHLPGGCIRFGETIAARIHATAISELGADVTAEETPAAVRELIQTQIRPGLRNQRERGHMLSLLFRCRLAPGEHVAAPERALPEPGALRWFSRLPKDLLSVHEIYRDLLAPWGWPPGGAAQSEGPNAPWIGD